MEIKGFTFWRSWHEQCELLDDADRLAYMDAIRRYAFDGTVPSKDNVSPIVYALFLGVIPNIDAGLNNALNGSKGGRPRKNPVEKQQENPLFNPPFENQERGLKSNKNLNLEFKEEVEGEFEEEGEGEVSPSAPSKKSRFVKPTEAELAGWLMREKGLSKKDANDMAEKFVYHYNSNGWMVGKTPMKCWRSAAAGWVKRDRQSAEAAQERAQGMNAAQNMAQYQYRAAESPQTHENGPGIVQMPEAMIQH